jgi:hypothetical protein
MNIPRPLTGRIPRAPANQRMLYRVRHRDGDLRPRAPQYYRASPTECVPFFGKLVSSMSRTAFGTRRSSSVCVSAACSGTHAHGL